MPPTQHKGSIKPPPVRSRKQMNKLAHITTGNPIRPGRGKELRVMTANVTLMGMGGDTMGPDFMDEPAVMSTSMMNQGTSAMVWLRMMDDACGLEGGSVTFSNESAGQRRSFSAAVTPNMASGGLAGCVPIPACAVSGTYTMSGISARDLGGHSVTLIEMGGTYNQIESDGMPGGGPTMIPSVMH